MRKRDYAKKMTEKGAFRPDCHSPTLFLSFFLYKETKVHLNHIIANGRNHCIAV
jgi:hypothetical protein